MGKILFFLKDFGGGRGWSMVSLSVFANCKLSPTEVRIPPYTLPPEIGALIFLDDGIITFQRDSSKVLEKDLHEL